MSKESFLTITKQEVGKFTQSSNLKSSPLTVGDTITIQSREVVEYEAEGKDKKPREFHYFLCHSKVKDQLIKIPLAEALLMIGAHQRDADGNAKFLSKFTIEKTTRRMLNGQPMFPLTLSTSYVPGDNDFSPAKIKLYRATMPEFTEKEIEDKCIKNYTVVEA
jgi:hypothetical protein